MSISKNIINQFIVQSTGIISGFFISIIIAKILGPAGRGEFAVFVTSLTFISIFLSLSINHSILYAISSNKFPIDKIFYTCLLFSLGLIFVNIIFFWTEFLFHSNFLFSNESITANALMILGFTIYLFISIINAVMAGLKIFKLQQLLSILFSILNIILFGGYFFIKVYVSPTVQIQFNDFLYFYTFTQIIILIITLYFFFKETPISFNISFLNFKDFKFLIAFSLTAYLANLFQFLTYKIDISFVDFYLGKSQLGVYSLATNLTRMFWVLPVSISTILIPYNATDELSRSTININKLTRTTIFMIVVIIAFSLPLIDLFIPFIYGNEFSEASTILKILIFGLIPFAATNIVLSFFSGRGLVKHNLIFAFIVFILTITGDYFLINSFGTVGASITNVLSYTLGFIYPLVIYINYTNASLSDLLIVKKLDFVEVKKKLSANLKLNIFKTPK